jgi:DNA-binding NarL/FixJ family response regulator
MANVKTLLIAAKYPILRLGIISVIENSKIYKVSAEFGLVEPEDILKSDVDASILAFGNYYALNLIKNLRKNKYKKPLLIIGNETDRYIAQDLFKAGGNGFVCKTEPAEGLITALNAVFKKGFYFSDSIPSQLVGNQDLDSLGKRELEILVLIGNGDSNPEIAQKLDMAVKTVDSHIHHIRNKLQLSTYPKLIHWATRWVSQTGAKL